MYVCCLVTRNSFRFLSGTSDGQFSRNHGLQPPDFWPGRNETTIFWKFSGSFFVTSKCHNPMCCVAWIYLKTKSEWGYSSRRPADSKWTGVTFLVISARTVSVLATPYESASQGGPYLQTTGLNVWLLGLNYYVLKMIEKCAIDFYGWRIQKIIVIMKKENQPQQFLERTVLKSQFPDLMVSEWLESRGRDMTKILFETPY